MFRAKNLNMSCVSLNLRAGKIYEGTESINYTASKSIQMEAGALVKFHGHTMTVSAPCEARSIISIDDHTLQVTDLAGQTHNYDMNSDVSYPS